MMEDNRKAVIFDLDGVIVDSGEVHFKSWHDTLIKRGASFTREDFRRIFGKRNDAIIREFLGDITEGEAQKVAEEKEVLFRTIARGNIRAIPGARELIKSLKEKGFKVGLGSSTVPENVELILRTLDIDRYFDAVATGSDVAESKPSPQLFLLVARRLGVPAEHCIVIEDAPVGIAAAKSGGMKAVAVTSTNPRESLAGADLIIDSLEELTVSDLERLLDRAEEG